MFRHPHVFRAKNNCLYSYSFADFIRAIAEVTSSKLKRYKKKVVRVLQALTICSTKAGDRVKRMDEEERHKRRDNRLMRGICRYRNTKKKLGKTTPADRVSRLVERYWLKMRLVSLALRAGTGRRRMQLLKGRPQEQDNALVAAFLALRSAVTRLPKNERRT